MIHLFSTPTPLNSSKNPIESACLRALMLAKFRVSSYANNMIAIMVPALLAVLIGGYRSSVHEIHHGLLAAIAGRFVASHNDVFNIIVPTVHSVVSDMVTEALKNRVGKS
jgi:hypothetical protein